jgi:hypothetical protein
MQAPLLHEAPEAAAGMPGLDYLDRWDAREVVVQGKQSM